MENLSVIPVPHTRRGIEHAIERLIGVLDSIEQDPDLEPNGDYEPSLSAGTVNFSAQCPLVLDGEIDHQSEAVQ